MVVSEKQRNHLEKLNRNQKGEKNRNYKGGIMQYGRKIIRVDGKSVHEHRVIMEKHLGRKFTKNEEVHHLNGEPLDNRIANLIILSKGDHTKLEAFLRRGNKVAIDWTNKKEVREYHRNWKRRKKEKLNQLKGGGCKNWI